MKHFCSARLFHGVAPQCTVLGISDPSFSQLPSYPYVVPYQTDVVRGGRAMAATANSFNPQRSIVATENGDIFNNFIYVGTEQIRSSSLRLPATIYRSRTLMRNELRQPVTQLPGILIIRGNATVWVMAPTSKVGGLQNQAELKMNPNKPPEPAQIIPKIFVTFAGGCFCRKWEANCV